MLRNHPNWKLIQATISDRTKYHTIPTEDKTRITYLRHQLSKSDHKSVSGKRATIITTKLAKEVNKGWCILILPNHALDITNLEISLLALAHQASINERRESIEKDRVTHDLSFPGIA